MRRASARGARAPAGAQVERGSGARGAAHRTREEEEKSITACAVLARLRQREPPVTHNCRSRVIRRDARWRGLAPHEAASEEDARQGQPATGLEKKRRAPQCATSLLDCGGENHRACATRRQCACASASIDRYGRSTPLNGSKKNCNRRAADDDPSDAEGRDGWSAVRGKRGPLARSTTRNGEAEKRTRRRCWSFRRCEQRSWSKPSTVEAEQIGRKKMSLSMTSYSWLWLWLRSNGCARPQSDRRFS